MVHHTDTKSSRHVAQHSIASFLPPYLPLPDYSKRKDQTQDSQVYEIFQTRSSQLLRYCFDLDINKDLISLLDDLSVLTAQLAHFLEEPQVPFEPLDMQTRGNMIQVRLLGIYSDVDNTSIRSPLEKTLCLTALVFAVLIFLPQPSLGAHGLHHAALDQLIEYLTLSKPDEWSEVPDLLMWVLVVGTVGARGSSKLSWFSNRLSSLCLDLQLTNLNDILERVRPLLWIDRLLTGSLTEFWLEFFPHT